MNLNKKTGIYQAFREGKKRNLWCTAKREFVGQITADSRFPLSKNFVLQLKLHEIRTQASQVESTEKQSTQSVINAIDDIADTSGIKAVVKQCSILMTALLLGTPMQELTGDAISCQVDFVADVYKQADYCISLKDNPKKS